MDSNTEPCATPSAFSDSFTVLVQRSSIMTDDRTKYRPRKLWLSVVGSLTPSRRLSISRPSKKPSLQPVRRHIKFSDSVVRFVYPEIRASYQPDGLALPRIKRFDLSRDPDMPRDAIIFGEPGIKNLSISRRTSLARKPSPRSHVSSSASTKTKETAPTSHVGRRASITAKATATASHMGRSLSRKARDPDLASHLGSRSSVKGKEATPASQVGRSSSTRLNETAPASHVSRSSSSKGKEATKQQGSKPLRDLWDLQRRTKQLLECFVVTDSRLENNPVYCMSSDIVSTLPIGEGDFLTFEDDIGVEGAGIVSFEHRSKDHHMLLLKREMVKLSSEQPSFTLYSQVNVTNLSKDDGLQDPDECIFLEMAIRELRTLLRRDGNAWRRLPKIEEPWRQHLIQGLEALLAFHELAFMVEVPEEGTSRLEIRHASARFLHTELPTLKDLQRYLWNDSFKIRDLLLKRQRFFFDARMGDKGPQQLVCCVPLYGPDLACFICFLVSGPVFERSAGYY